jgi:hypothetical protein
LKLDYHALKSRLNDLKAELSAYGAKTFQREEDVSGNESVKEQAQKVEVFAQKVEGLDAFFQGYINAQVHHRTTYLQVAEISTWVKFNMIEWLVLSARFIEEDVYNGCLDVYWAIATKPQEDSLKKALTKKKHSSSVVATTISLIKETSVKSRKLFRIYLRTLETLILNEFNLYQAVNLGLVKLLMAIFMDDRHDQLEKRAAIRSLAFSCKKPSIVSYIAADPGYLLYLGESLKTFSDEEILQHVARTVRILMRDPSTVQEFYRLVPTLIDTFFQNIRKFVYARELTDETLACIKNYTFLSDNVAHIQSAEQLNKVIEFISDVSNSQKKQFSIAILRNCAKKEEFLEHM